MKIRHLLCYSDVVKMKKSGFIRVQWDFFVSDVDNKVTRFPAPRHPPPISISPKLHNN